MTTPVEQVKAALLRRSSFEPVLISGKDHQLRLVGRVTVSRPIQDWNMLIEHLLRSSADVLEWSVDISKNFMLKEGSLVWGWRLIFQGDFTDESIVRDIVNQIESFTADTGAARFEVTEQPLIKHSARNRVHNGKGAQLTEQSGRGAAVGPALAMASRGRKGGY